MQTFSFKFPNSESGFNLTCRKIIRQPFPPPPPRPASEKIGGGRGLLFELFTGNYVAHFE